ncbi:MAG TPA: diaminopimelate epimerase [candidate division Zixibacteria bacterium]|nr:diaminopimelate epimerase [candidate division Zixibacteria bacterium]
MISFVKMSGSGNDFIVIDNRGEKIITEDAKSDFVMMACRRRASIGADGVLFVEDSKIADFRMRYFNSDGGEVEFCGNGGRCIAHFAHHQLGFTPRVEFDSGAGIVSAEVDGDFVALQMPPASEPSDKQRLEILGQDIEFYTINTGVPHLVIFVEDLEGADVIEIGRAMRFHDFFAPDGTNTNFARIAESPNYEMEIRTYERGVEDETLACGTGVTAVALVSAKLGFIGLPARLRVALPDILTVDLDSKGRPIFSGEVKFIYTGNYKI